MKERGMREEGRRRNRKKVRGMRKGEGRTR